MVKRGIATAVAVIIAALILALHRTPVAEARPVQHGCIAPANTWPLWNTFFTVIHHGQLQNTLFWQAHNHHCGKHTPSPETATPTVTATGTATPTRTPRPPSRANPPRPVSTATPTRTPTATSTATPTVTVTPTGMQTVTPTATPAGAPSSPQGQSGLSTPALTVLVSENTIELRWDAVSGAVRYELWTWWNTEPGWQQIGGDDLVDTAYTHKDVMAGTTYWYAIRAVGSDGETSAWSEFVTAILVSPSVPSLSAEVTANGIELTWTTVLDAARYELWVWTTEAGWLRLDDATLTGTSFTHSGLTPGTTYWYAIRAVDATGAASEWSQHIHATVPASQTSRERKLPAAF